LKQFGKEIEADVGEPLEWSELSELSEFATRQTLTDFLYQKVQDLAPIAPLPTKKKRFLKRVR